MNSNKLIERLELALDMTESSVKALKQETGNRKPAAPNRNKRNPKLDLLIRKVLSRGIDPHWLLTGSGSMYRKECHADAGREARELRNMEHMLTRVYHRLKTIG